MRLKALQAWMRDFEKERGWEYFSSSLIFTHLVEEISEIGEHILFKEGYKIEPPARRRMSQRHLESEFAQVLTLLAQIANRFNVELEAAVNREVRTMEKRFNRKLWIAHVEALRRKARLGNSA